jgi:hypothetical protein
MSTTKTFQPPRPKVSSTMTSQTSIRPISPPKNMFKKETSNSLSELPEDALIHDLTTNFENIRIDKKSPELTEEEKRKRLKERESQGVTKAESSGLEQRRKKRLDAASSESNQAKSSGREQKFELFKQKLSQSQSQSQESSASSSQRVKRVPSNQDESSGRERLEAASSESNKAKSSGRELRFELLKQNLSQSQKQESQKQESSASSSQRVKRVPSNKDESSGRERFSSTEKSKEVEKDKAPIEVIEIPKVVSSRYTKEIKVLDIPQKGSILESLRKNTSKASVYNPEASFNKSEAIKTKLETIEDKKLQTIKLPVSRESKLTITQFLSTIEQKKKIPTQEEANISVGKMEEDVVAPTQLIRKQKVPDEIDLNEEIVAPTKLIRKQKVVPDEIDSSRVKSSEKSSDIQELIQDLIKNKAKISSASSRGKDFYSLQELQEIRKKLKIPTAKSKEELVQKILERLAQEEKVEK